MAKINKDDLKIGVTFTPCSKCGRVEVVHGRWDKYARYMICSVCDIGFCYYKNETHRFRYCPNCGAKMEGGNDNV